MIKQFYVLLSLTALLATSCQQLSKSAKAPCCAVMPDTLGHGSFVNTDAHALSGEAYLYKDAEGKRTLVFDSLSVINGPDVDIYLSATDSFSTQMLKVAHLDGPADQPLSGRFTYSIPAKADLTKYSYVVIWCRMYSVRFGYAELK